MYKYMIDESNEGYDIYVNLISSRAGHYLSRRPHILALLKELLNAKTLSGKRVVIEKDMGRDIGTTDIVLTNDKDTIYYAQALRSEVFVRFARNRYPQISTKLTVIAKKDTEGNYEVSDTWIGANYPAFPGDEFETADSKEFWETHALVQDALAVQSKTITKVCPY
jgi:hypothetical protein